MHLDYSTTLFYSSCKSYTTHFLAAMEHHIWHGNCKWQESPPENMYLQHIPHPLNLRIIFWHSSWPWRAKYAICASALYGTIPVKVLITESSHEINQQDNALSHEWWLTDLHLKAEHQLVTNGKQTQLLCSYMQIIFHHTEGYILLLSQNLTPMGIPKGRSSRVQVTFTNLWNLMTKSSPHKSSPLHHMTQQLLAPVGQPQVWRHRTCLTMPRNGRRVTAIKDPSMKTRSDWHYSLSRTLIIEAIHLGNLLNP
jgi:hypothetical protein